MIEVSGKIKWQSRRGMRELDLMLLPFVEIDLPKLTNQDLEEYFAGLTVQRNHKVKTAREFYQS